MMAMMVILSLQKAPKCPKQYLNVTYYLNGKRVSQEIKTKHREWGAAYKLVDVRNGSEIMADSLVVKVLQ